MPFGTQLIAMFTSIETTPCDGQVPHLSWWNPPEFGWNPEISVEISILIMESSEIMATKIRTKSPNFFPGWNFWVKSNVAITGLKPSCFSSWKIPQNPCSRSWSRCTAFRDRSSRLLRSIFTLGISPKFRSQGLATDLFFNDEKNLKHNFSNKPFY